MNNELGADFKPESFRHYTSYAPASGEVLSYLISLQKQRVYFSDLDLVIAFEKHELIYTEVSKKYTLEEFEKLASSQGLELITHFLDSKSYFTDTLFKI